MQHRIVIQYGIPKKTPGVALLRRWANAALTQKKSAVEVTIRIVDIAEMTTLNTTYRHKKGPTNVLAFPFEMPEMLRDESTILGDIVICSEVVHREAQEQNKPPKAHWAHMVVHGTLHLLGFDHVKAEDADIMEAHEIKILKTLGFEDPYQLSSKKVTHHG